MPYRKDLLTPLTDAYYEPRVRRSFREWFYDLLVPASPYEAEYRVLLLEQAKRTALRTELQRKRTAAMQERATKREAERALLADQYMPVAVWEYPFTHGGKSATAFVELRQNMSQREVKLVRATQGGYPLAEAKLVDIWEFLKTVEPYIYYVRPWLDEKCGPGDLVKAQGIRVSEIPDTLAKARRK